MSDVDEKLIVRLGQRIAEQNEILRMIAVSLQGVEARLRQMAGFWCDFSGEGRLRLFQLLLMRQALLPILVGSGPLDW